MKKTDKYLLTFVAAIFCMPTQAHDAWVEPQGADYAVIYGHDGKLEGYPPSKVKTIAAFDALGAALPIKQTATADAVSFAVTGKPALMALYYDNGFWTKTTNGIKNLAKNEVPDAINASHVVKFSKTVLAWSPNITKPQDQRLEIVPLSSDAPAAGKTLAVQVLWEGKPLDKAKIEPIDGRSGIAVSTDAEGRAMLPVAAGRQAYAVSNKVALAGDARADSYSATANLVFYAK